MQYLSNQVESVKIVKKKEETKKKKHISGYTVKRF